LVFVLELDFKEYLQERGWKAIERQEIIFPSFGSVELTRFVVTPQNQDNQDSKGIKATSVVSKARQ
jgi:hypothetical protein